MWACADVCFECRGSVLFRTTIGTDVERYLESRIVCAIPGHFCVRITLGLQSPRDRQTETETETETQGDRETGRQGDRERHRQRENALLKRETPTKCRETLMSCADISVQNFWAPFTGSTILSARASGGT